MNLHLVRNPVAHDSRVLKETQSLLDVVKRLEICGFHEPGYELEETLGNRVVRRIQLITRRLPKDIVSQSVKYVEWYARIVHRYRRMPLKVIHCHDLEPLPIAVKLKQLTGARLIYDAHELETEAQGSHGFRQELARWLERRLIPKVDAMITVSPSIRDWYQQRYPAVPVCLVRNIPDMPRQAIIPRSLRTQLKVQGDALLFIYLGGLVTGRSIESVLKAFADERVRHHVLFMGNGPLKTSVETAAQDCKRIHYMPPVPPVEVLSYAAGADVGLCPIEDTCLSNRYCLPNKLFESLLGGLPVLVSDLPDQANIVRSHKAGWVIPNNPEAMTTFLSNLSADEGRSLRSGLLERVSDLRWQNEARILLNIYGQ